MKKRGYPMTKLDTVMRSLARGETLGPTHRPHPLQGEFADCWECHLGGDWLLIWRIEGEVIVFVRTGTHADLFE